MRGPVPQGVSPWPADAVRRTCSSSRLPRRSSARRPRRLPCRPALRRAPWRHASSWCHCRRLYPGRGPSPAWCRRRIPRERTSTESERNSQHASRTANQRPQTLCEGASSVLCARPQLRAFVSTLVPPRRPVNRELTRLGQPIGPRGGLDVQGLSSRMEAFLTTTRRAPLQRPSRPAPTEDGHGDATT